jgi:DNA-binding transcriptional LysR family regulator
MIPNAQALARRLKLRQLVLLRALGDSGNLRRSAAAVSLTQPAATRMLQELEETLGLKLFERSPRGMAPTPYGEAMIRHAGAVLADLDSAREELTALAEGLHGRVAVGTLMSTASLLLPRTIARAKARAPRLQVFVQEGTHEQLLEALLAGDLDLMLGRVLPGDARDAVSVEILYREEFRVVCGSANLLARRRARLGDLVDHPWILPPPHVPLRQRLDALFLSQTGRRPVNLVESISVVTNLTLLRESSALGVLPAQTAKQYAKLGLLAELNVSLKDILGPVALVTRRNHARSPAAESFLALLRGVAQELHRNSGATETR